MNTESIQFWCREALALKRRVEKEGKALTAQSCVSRTRPEGATSGDEDLLYKMLVPQLSLTDRKVVDFTYDEERRAVAQKNSEGMSRVLEQTGVLIPTWEFAAWRPTERNSGEIQGVVGCTIYATDGEIGVFVEEDGTAFKGHVKWFSGEVRALFNAPKAEGQSSSTHSVNSKRRKPRKSVEQKALDELKALGL